MPPEYTHKRLPRGRQLKTLAILGTVGIPACYGGFETLAENLARYHQSNGLACHLVVYCSGNRYRALPAYYLGAQLRYIRINANGVASVLYDVVSLLSAVRHGYDRILLLGVSGAVALPLVRLLSGAHVITNLDGIEWKRGKWNALARWWLRQSERWAVRYSHEVVADNEGMAEHINEVYGRQCAVIAYGGDHALTPATLPYSEKTLPPDYALALCRIEPENNVELILRAFKALEVPLVFLGNWSNSAHGEALRQRYGAIPNLYLLDPVYEPGMLRGIREKARMYVHGHSAGGTNPSLVEMMHFGVPVLAFDCIFNRYTTDDKALFFSTSEELRTQVNKLKGATAKAVGAEMLRIAQARYTWDIIGKQYFRLFSK